MICRHSFCLNENPLTAKLHAGLAAGRGGQTSSVIAVLVWTLAGSLHPASSQAAEPAAAAHPSAHQLNAPGTEGRMLAAQAGTWIVTETSWETPNAQPLVTNNLIAERRMIGKLLEETLSAESNPTVLRRDFLTFNRVEGRWEYMSFDTRAAVGMMTAQSHGPETGGKIELVFQPFALPTGGTTTGRMLRMRQQIIRDGDDHVIKDQYFTLADGRGEEWLAHRYDASRRR